MKSQNELDELKFSQKHWKKKNQLPHPYSTKKPRPISKTVANDDFSKLENLDVSSEKENFSQFLA